MAACRCLCARRSGQFACPQLWPTGRHGDRLLDTSGQVFASGVVMLDEGREVGRVSGYRLPPIREHDRGAAVPLAVIRPLRAAVVACRRPSRSRMSAPSAISRFPCSPAAGAGSGMARDGQPSCAGSLFSRCVVRNSVRLRARRQAGESRAGRHDGKWPCVHRTRGSKRARRVYAAIRKSITA
jgi:hypothetical protein